MQKEEKQGIIIVATAYVLWGFMPIFWKMLSHVSSDEILAGRVIWSFVFTLLLVVIGRNYKQLVNDIQELWKDRKAFWSLVLASYLVTGNWFIFIYAVNAGYIVQTSLGYYINPLLSVVLGIVFLKEKLSRAQVLAVVIAAIGVLILSISYGQVPWISFSLAITFAFYGLIKKTLKVDALRGLTIETFFVLPVALIYFAYIVVTGKAVFFSTDILTVILLLLTGVATAVPLVLFAKGTKNIPLYMSGFIQYIAPTLMLLIGVIIYKEQFSKIEFLSFSFIWCALILFTVSKIMEVRKRK
ncbi:EamA family transporter RarD [Psychrobacillus lasiicapitis]|uniref:EamA family transporter RarD n=1 Tax=Psychrobacillus lasiicapitis TaxID=1636719 RepID=A0A544T936_9BACI|nr:EamA family transporter RarD [Psychrobacillus lasiicapitis]TQR13969.1 EamA family transporter RarD [Psychrobacillus lasiicapitis]GGA37046.1 transporter [Psychrobacillus lasiicapitis]